MNPVHRCKERDIISGIIITSLKGCHRRCQNKVLPQAWRLFPDASNPTIECKQEKRSTTEKRLARRFVWQYQSLKNSPNSIPRDRRRTVRNHSFIDFIPFSFFELSFYLFNKLRILKQIHHGHAERFCSKKHPLVTN